jgi:hypothetical protein
LFHKSLLLTPVGSHRIPGHNNIRFILILFAYLHTLLSTEVSRAGFLTQRIYLFHMCYNPRQSCLPLNVKFILIIPLGHASVCLKFKSTQFSKIFRGDISSYASEVIVGLSSLSLQTSIVLLSHFKRYCCPCDCCYSSLSVA